jgi:uncharacterized protein (DUF885 family)
MTSDEMNRTIEFMVQHQAEFGVRQDRDHEMLIRSFAELRESTSRFQSWAAEVVALEASRLDRHDSLHRDALQFQQDALEFQRQALHLLNLILDRLPRRDL